MAKSGSIEHVYKSWFYARLYWEDVSTTENISNKTTAIKYTLRFWRNSYNVGDRKLTITFGDVTKSYTIKGSVLDNSTSTTKDVDLATETITLKNTVTNGVGVCNFNYSFSLAVDATLSGTKVSKLAASGTGTAEPQYYNPNGRVINEFKTFRVDSESSSDESNAGEVVYTQIRLSGGVQANCSVNIYYRQTDVPTTTTYDGKVTLTPAQLTSALSASGLSGTAVLTGKRFSKEYAHHFLLEFAEAIPDSTGYYEPEIAKASIPKSSMVMHLAGNPSGGVAFGQFSTSTQDNPKFECNYPATFYQGVNIQGSLGDTLKSTILDVFYPVGALYISTKSTSPATLLGGTWTQITDRFLVAQGSTYTGTGGAASYALSVAAHKHTINTYNNVKFVSGAVTSGSYNIPITNTSDTAGAISATIPTVPPYKAVYVWERTA